MKTVRLLSAFGLIPASALACLFGFLCTAPIRISGPMNFSPFGETEFALYVGVPLLLALLVLTWLAFPYRLIAKWILLTSSVAVSLFTLYNFFHFPISAYTGYPLYDPYEPGHDGCIPAHGLAFFVAAVFAITLLAVSIWLHRSQPGSNNAVQPTASRFAAAGG